MSGAVASHRTTTKAFYSILAFSIAMTLAAACEVPNLEPSDCTQARVRVREFYSFHFGNDMHATLENVRLRERFLTEAYAAKLRVDASGMPPTKIDYFTGMDDFPKAFRVGKCSVLEPGKAVQFEVVLFWKDDTRSDQKEILVNARHENDDWLIDGVGPKDR